jgi:hypothetical protein
MGLVLTSALALLITGPAVSIESDLRSVLRRTGEYVEEYHDNLTTVVADELYVQRLSRGSAGETQTRTLKSELAIARGETEDGWFAIRDVLEVDGQPVGERSQIDALLRVPRARLRTAAFAIAVEQMKYNLGAVSRTINVPTLPLMFLLPDHQTRFRFRSGGTATMSGTTVILISYEERERPTIIRTPNGRSVVSRGTLWIDQAKGRVLKTELVTNEPRGLKAVITVDYEYDTRLNLLVPATMSESYATAEEEITTTATYSNFRRFEADARIVR